MIFYFSGTGNSAWVARQIAKAQQEELLAIAEEINKNKEYALKDGEKVGFVFPVYAWGPPGIVLRFIRQLKMKNPEYLFFVCGLLPVWTALDRKSTRLNSSHSTQSRMPSSA